MIKKFVVPKNQNDHEDITSFRLHGLSIKVKNTRLVFSQGIDPFSNTKEVLQLPASACPFDKIVIQDKGYVSTESS
jgi:hypothetical protein